MMDILCWYKIILRPLSDNTSRGTREFSFISLNLYNSLVLSGMFLILILHFVFVFKWLPSG